MRIQKVQATNLSNIVDMTDSDLGMILYCVDSVARDALSPRNKKMAEDLYKELLKLNANVELI